MAIIAGFALTRFDVFNTSSNNAVAKDNCISLYEQVEDIVDKYNTGLYPAETPNVINTAGAVWYIINASSPMRIDKVVYCGNLINDTVFKAKDNKNQYAVQIKEDTSNPLKTRILIDCVAYADGKAIWYYSYNRNTNKTYFDKVKANVSVFNLYKFILYLLIFN
jgi:hypothetical protein